MTNMYPVKVSWSKDVYDIYDYEDRFNDYLYMILRARRYRSEMKYKILYIGKAYRQWCADRLNGSNHKYWDILVDQYGKGDVVARFGNIILPEGRIISEKLVNDIEAVLINDTQPEYNEMSIYAYRSNRDLKITNTGTYMPLNRTINTSDWEYI